MPKYQYDPLRVSPQIPGQENRLAQSEPIKSMKRPNPEKLQRTVDAFNARFPIGTAVTRYALIEPLREPTETKTRSAAWVMGGHSAMVLLEGQSGGHLLEAIRVL